MKFAFPTNFKAGGFFSGIPLEPSAAAPPPLLPLVLWRPPPGLELVLGQEGVPYEVVSSKTPRPWSFRAGRFVLFDRRATGKPPLDPRLGQIPIDLGGLRGDPNEEPDPFESLITHHSQRMCWAIDGVTVHEQLASVDKAAIRLRIAGRLQRMLEDAGGIWARLSPYPYPYRSAVSFRVDLDEDNPDDYARFARARGDWGREGLTHFVSTHAYGRHPEILRDLQSWDVQSHGHYHAITRNTAFNRTNLQRADDILRAGGIQPRGFAAPHGAWSPELDGILEELGYEYSSDFQVGYDDYPFFPWRNGRFSRVLQVPIVPICEGLWIDQGIRDFAKIREVMSEEMRIRLNARQTAFMYGHPERRLARDPEFFPALAAAVEEFPQAWRVTLTEYARWWRYRSAQKWSLVRPDASEDVWEVRREGADAGDFPPGLEICRGDRSALIPLNQPLRRFALDELDFEPIASGAVRWAVRPYAPEQSLRLSMKQWIRHALDWQPAIPPDELPQHTWKGLAQRLLRSRTGAK